MRKLDFGIKLIEVRKARGLTQEDVAEKCKITVRTIQRIEAGVVKPRVYTIKIISDILGIDCFYDTSNTGYDVNIANRDSNLERHAILWYLTDLFNFKTKAMKKISILTMSSFMIGFTSFVMVSKTNAQSDKNVFKSIAVQYNVDKSIKRIEARFSNNLTYDSLVNIKNTLKSNEIIINYKKIEFDENNHLKEIACEVFTKQGSGSFAIPLLNTVNKGKKIG